MRKIGEGWQYSVYDLENGRVLKKFHSFIQSYWVILKTIFPSKDDPLMMVPDFSRSMKKKALASFAILKRIMCQKPCCIVMCDRKSTSMSHQVFSF